MSRLGILIALLIAAGLVVFGLWTRVTGTGQPSSAALVAPVARTPASRPGGALVVPVQGVDRAALQDDWAEPRGDGTRVHHAIDIMAPIGTPVVAVADGRIEKLFQSGQGGTTIYERSADGSTIYYYAHLDRYAPTLVEQQPVRAGQVIAAVGSTGDADPGAPHLHFEVHRMAPREAWWQGAEVNPYPLLKRGAP